MIRNQRNLTQDIFDYSGNKVCPLYDRTSDMPGQAVNVFVITERNGWRELSFTIPSTYKTSEGEEENYRLKYLIGDYRIRLIDDEGVDWFLISEPKVTHSAFSKDVQVSAGHISQQLKTKNLGLEFTDKAGNNVGTAHEQLTTILAGTGWNVGNVATFFEKDGKTVKKRSLKASAKTGAYKLIAKMCDQFEAKPIYHGEGRTVDIVPLNPFSRPVNVSIPDLSNTDGVVELHYGSNVKNVTRTINTENLITKLYAYGSYGDDVTGYCGQDEIEYSVQFYEVITAVKAGTPTLIHPVDPTGVSVTYSFTPNENIAAGDVQKFSFYDNASTMYVWNTRTQKAYRTVKNGSGTDLYSKQSYEKERNYFSFLMDFSYYDKSGLLNDAAVQAIAEYQQKGSTQKKAVLDRTTEMNESLLALTQTIGSVDYCKLHVSSVGYNGTEVTLTLTGNEDDLGVEYRTDYGVLKKDRFKWRTSTGVKPTGESINSEASVLYIIRDGNPVEWHKVYIKSVEQKTDSIVLTLWLYDKSGILASDNYYLFASNNVNGYLGSLETADESAVITLENAVKIVTTDHPVYFEKTAPAISEDEQHGYGWWCKYYDENVLPELYFCYYSNGDASWKYVYCQSEQPSIHNDAYWYDWKKAVLYRCTGGMWKQLLTEDSESSVIGDETYSVRSRVVESFSSVYRYMLTRDRYYKGQYQYLTANIQNVKPVGKYYIKDAYNSFYVFTTTEILKTGDSLTYDTTEGYIIQTASGEKDTLEMKTYRFDNVKYHSSNVQENATFSQGSLDLKTGGEINEESMLRSGFVSVYPQTKYSCNAFPSETKVLFYTITNKYVGYIDVSGATSQTTDENARYIRVVSSSTKEQLQNVKLYTPSYASSIVIENETYEYIGDVVGSGELKGIVPQIKKFSQQSDIVYKEKLAAVKSAQAAFSSLEAGMIDKLGDMYREGYWQSEDYVDGDEQKLYDDAVDNLTELAQPDVSYSIGFIDKYGVKEFSNVDQVNDVMWPDLSISSAAHLIDPDISVNCWAYIDKVSKCYDQPRKTTIAINTKMSTIGQHSFTDVLTNIANVASELKGKESIYDRAGVISSSGSFFAERLEGKIDANKQLISGGSSTWYTDDRGNLVFESSDGLSAMTLTGNGFAIANSKDIWGNWNWRTFGTGEGFTADMITAGYLSADRIETGSIGSGKLSTAVTNELDKIAGIEGWVEEAKINLTPQKISMEVVKSAEFSAAVNDAAQSIVAGKTYIQYNEPEGAFSVGDVWIKTNKPDVTWNTLKDLTWEEVSNDIWGNWGTSEEPVTHIWDGSSWIVISDLTAIMEMRTSIEQTSEQIKQLATKTELVDGELRKVETVVTQTAEEIKRLATKDEMNTLVTQTAEKLESKADKTFKDKNGKTVELYTVVTQTAEEITQMVKKDGVIAAINLSSEEAYILAPKIKLEGLVTANNYFKVLTDGSIEATNAVISGKITATSGEIGGWKVDTGKLYSGSGTNRVELSTSDATYAIWAGNETAANAPFRVGKNGSLFASNADIAGKITSSSGSIGGWTLATGYMYSGSGANGVYLSTTDTTYRIWAGADTAASAPFRVGKNGSLYASNAEITGKITSTNADITGKITANDGQIGGWNIGTNLLYAGSGSNRVALSTGDAIYAMWAGNETASSAPFRVTKDGKVYLTRVMALANETDTTPSELDLSNVAFWKLNRAVKTLSVSGDTLTIALYNGTSVNFKKAGYTVAQLALRQGDPQGRPVFAYNSTTHKYNCQKTVYLDDTSGNYLGKSTTVNETSGTEAYDAGWNAATISSIVRDGDDSYSDASHNTTIYIKATASNGNSGTQSFVVSGSNAYLDGRQYGANTLSMTPDPSSSPTVVLGYGEARTVTATTKADANTTVTKAVTLVAPADRYNQGKTDGANSLVFYAGGYSGVADLGYGESVSITATTTRGDGTSKAESILVKAPVDRYTDAYKAGWDAAVAKIERDGNVIKGPSSTVDEQTNLFTITAGGSLNNITNTAANYFNVNGYAYAYIDGINVASRFISKANQINVGQ